MDYRTHCTWIHQALHNPNSTGVKIGGILYRVQVGEAGVRYLRYNGEMFCEQNKDRKKTSKWANMARTGKYQITWIIREKDTWGRIVSTPETEPKIEVP